MSPKTLCRIRLDESASRRQVTQMARRPRLTPQLTVLGLVCILLTITTTKPSAEDVPPQMAELHFRDLRIDLGTDGEECFFEHGETFAKQLRAFVLSTIKSQ